MEHFKGTQVDKYDAENKELNTHLFVNFSVPEHISDILVLVA